VCFRPLNRSTITPCWSYHCTTVQWPWPGITLSHLGS